METKTQSRHQTKPSEEYKDLIHDIAFDFYGRRLATCSFQNVKVWDVNDDGQWHLRSSWKSHDGSVWKVTWGHPEYGQILATCSFDRTAVLWEEMDTGVWVRRHTFGESRTSVTDIKFAPKQYALMFATCSSDGFLRIYETPDTMVLSVWTLLYEVNTGKACSCISWNASLIRLNCPMLVVGSDDEYASGSKLQFFELTEQNENWHLIDDRGWEGVSDLVYDVSFAPNMGRSFDLVGIATSKSVMIISVKLNEIGENDGALLTTTMLQGLTPSNPRKRYYQVTKLAAFEEHNSQVWRVSWNITGTILASSGDDGCVRLWKANALNNWKLVGQLKADQNLLKGITKVLNHEEFDNKQAQAAVAGLSSITKMHTGGQQAKI